MNKLWNTATKSKKLQPIAQEDLVAANLLLTSHSKM